jgi:decaprenyl-phosphate phosphoribosyltransferase
MFARIIPYIDIARPDHWFKNIFMLPGILLALFFSPEIWPEFPWGKIVTALASACLVASSNYVLNEILDREKDKHHPQKRLRPIPSGKVSIPAAYAEWLFLGAVGIAVGFAINAHFGVMAVLLWVAGTLYNVPPIRLKDHAYTDVLSESLNNPIRFAMGWYATGIILLPPLSMLLAYWMFGAFLMAMKRYAEYRHIGDGDRAARYRNSFAYYNEERLIESIFFYGASFGMLSGFFLARYQVELILAAPIVAYAMAYYMHLGFKPDSPVQRPEGLYKARKLVVLILLAFIAVVALMVLDIPAFRDMIRATPLVH